MMEVRAEIMEGMDSQLRALCPRPAGRPKSKISRPAPKDILDFFIVERTIPQARIGAALKVTQSLICYWFKHSMPEKREVELRQLMAKVVKWENETGKKFGS